MILLGRIILVVATTAGLMLSIAYAAYQPDSIVSFAAPIAVAAGVLLIVHHGYLLIRWIRWQGRRCLEVASLQDLNIPDDVPKPRQFAGVTAIDHTLHMVVPTVPDYQGAMYARGVKVAVLPALAVLLAAIPSLRPDDSGLAVGSPVAELVVVLAVVLLVRRTRNPSTPWVEARTRSELLRREQYLRLAEVGPYKNLGPPEADALTARRLADLNQGTGAKTAALIPMRAENAGVRWIDQLWTAPYQALPDLRQRARTYLHYRIDKQVIWFRLGATATDRAERQIAKTIVFSLVLAMVILAAQTAMHLTKPVWTDRITPVATLLALVLPPVAAFLIAIRELYSYRGLSASYAQMLGELTTERRALYRLIDRIEEAGTDLDAISREFQAAVLHTEAALTIELQRWIMITERDRFDLDA